MNKIVVVAPNGDITVTENASPPTLAEMQTLVGGYIELMYWPTTNVQYAGEEAQYYVNEEGLLMGLPVNLKASELAAVEEWQAGRPLVGTMVILTGSARCE